MNYGIVYLSLNDPYSVLIKNITGEPYTGIGFFYASTSTGTKKILVTIFDAFSFTKLVDSTLISLKKDPLIKSLTFYKIDDKDSVVFKSIITKNITNLSPPTDQEYVNSILYRQIGFTRRLFNKIIDELNSKQITLAEPITENFLILDPKLAENIARDKLESFWRILRELLLKDPLLFNKSMLNFSSIIPTSTTTPCIDLTGFKEDKGRLNATLHWGIVPIYDLDIMDSTELIKLAEKLNFSDHLFDALRAKVADKLAELYEVTAH